MLYALSAWLIMAAFYSYQYVLRVMPAIIMPDLTAKFHITPEQFANFSGIYYLGYTLIHIPLGLLIDKIGTKHIVSICLILVSLGSAPLVFSDSWTLVVMGRLLLGMASAAAIIGTFRVIRTCFTEDKFALMLGITATTGVLGAIYGGSPLSILIQNLGWQKVLMHLMVLGLLLSFISYLLLPGKDKNEDNNRLNARKSIINDLKIIFSNYKILLLSLLGGLMVGPIEGFADGWSATFFKVVYKMDDIFANSASSVIFLGMSIGSPILGYLAGRSKAYYPIIITCAIIMCLAFIGITKIDFDVNINTSEFYILQFVLFLIGILSSYQVPLMDKITSLVPIKLLGLATATSNMIVMVFGYIFHNLIGMVISYYWDGKTDNGVNIYSPQSLKNAMSIIIIALLISSIGFIILMLRDRKFTKQT